MWLKTYTSWQSFWFSTDAVLMKIGLIEQNWMKIKIHNNTTPNNNQKWLE